ncbi:unnamed protein product [Rhizoctonia solani]|uniref:t-SNARE coiled-coil homology domain-containing protein n=1 Tax=Rhizoctonia solani TaxID=456999 RepID=A0A8H3GAI9_9AGAM|nr:unnamed protein product [Rhizoctonia solani]
MATDRLAALRAERAQQYQQPAYQPQEDSTQYQMNAYPPQSNTDSMHGTNGYGNGETADTEMTRFYDEITAIQDLIHSYRDNITRISNLHSRSLTVTDDDSLRQSTAELDTIASQTHDLSAQIKQRIQTLEAKRGKVQGRDKDAWIQQTNVVKTRFVAAIQEYQQAEQQYRQRSRQRVERQVRIVKPDATQQEIDSVVNNEQGAQVFSQALMSSNRYGESRLAYREVQARHDDIKKIEKTLTELAQLFSDMSVMVAQQDETIDAIETHAAQADKAMEQGLQETDKAVDHARAARKKRWICFWISVAILCVIAIILAVVLTRVIPKNNK